MPTTKPKVLILGATGKVGGAVVPELAANPELQVVVGARSPEKWHTPGTTAVRLDLDRVETLAPALEGVERAFLVTGSTVDMLRQSKDFLNAAKRAGVKHVVHLGACGDDEVFDNFPAITDRRPPTLADFAITHAARFKY